MYETFQRSTSNFDLNASKQMASSRKGVSLFIPHGGGPMPVLGDPGHAALTAWLNNYPKSLPKFSSIIVFSAHWEARVPTITSGASHELIYDYGGFPAESYKLKYPCPGNPALAKKIGDLFTKNGIQNKLDDKRGYDHGTFIPLMLMYPQADVPVVQVSLVSGLDPDLHIRMGKALAPLLEDENVLVLGSGFTFHNMRAFFNPSGVETPNEAFEAYLREALTEGDLSSEERAKRLVDWAKAPGGQFCHPREEHLIPLHVCFGAGLGAKAELSADLRMMNVRTSGYRW